MRREAILWAIETTNHGFFSIRILWFWAQKWPSRWRFGLTGLYGRDFRTGDKIPIV